MAKIKALKHGTPKDLIIQKAAGLFRKKGFNATSMRELAEIIGVEASSLYNHIGSKSELLEAICCKTADAFNEQLEDATKTDADVSQKLEKIIRFHIRMMLESFDEVFVSNHEWKHLKEPLLSNYLVQRKNYENKLVSLIREGIQLKIFKNIQPRVAALTILSAVRGLEFWQRHQKEMDISELENNMIQHLLYGLTK